MITIIHLDIYHDYIALVFVNNLHLAHIVVHCDTPMESRLSPHKSNLGICR